MLEIDKELEPFVTNYKLNLFDYHNCEDFSVFKTENRELFELLSCAGDRKKMNQLLAENQERYNRLTPETAQTICDIAGIKRHCIQKTNKENKEEVDMCRAWDEQEEWGRQKGLVQGRIEGHMAGRLEGKVESIRNIMDSLKITAIEAMDILKIEKEERTEYLELIK